MSNKAPEPVIAARLAAGDDYASVDDILECQDIPESTIYVPFWKRRGKPVALRVRGLDLEQQDKVRMAAARRVAKEDRELGIKQHYPTLVTATLCEGIVSPKLTPEQATKLRKKNAVACAAIAEYIWHLSRVDQEYVNARVAELAGLADEPGGAGSATAADRDAGDPDGE